MNIMAINITNAPSSSFIFINFFPLKVRNSNEVGDNSNSLGINGLRFLALKKEVIRRHRLNEGYLHCQIAVQIPFLIPSLGLNDPR